MTLGTIIAIVLGIAVLVFLIFGFSMGWNNMWDKITNIGGGKVNVDSVSSGCKIACSSNSEYGYCTEKRTVNWGRGDGSSELTCKGFAMDSKSGYDGCSNINCPSVDSVMTGEAP